MAKRPARFYSRHNDIFFRHMNQNQAILSLADTPDGALYGHSAVRLSGVNSFPPSSQTFPGNRGRRSSSCSAALYATLSPSYRSDAGTIHGLRKNAGTDSAQHGWSPLRSFGFPASTRPSSSQNPPAASAHHAWYDMPFPLFNKVATDFSLNYSPNFLIRTNITKNLSSERFSERKTRLEILVKVINKYCL